MTTIPPPPNDVTGVYKALATLSITRREFRNSGIYIFAESVGELFQFDGQASRILGGGECIDDVDLSREQNVRAEFVREFALAPTYSHCKRDAGCAEVPDSV